MKPRSVASARYALIVALVLGLTAAKGIAASGPARLASRDGGAREPGRPGSADNPIPLHATEINALRRAKPATPGALTLTVGPLRTSLFESSGMAYAGGSRPAPYADGPWRPEANRYSGAGLDVALERSGAVFLDGARVVLREPLDVLERGGAGGEYWTTAVGVEVRF